MLDVMQRAFIAAVRGATPELNLGTCSIPSSVTWQIYRRNYLEGHVAALADTYSTVRALVGHDFFRMLAMQFVSESPSLSGDLNDYGRDFPQFLAVSQPSESLPYLADVARLDWAFLQTLLAPDPAGDWLPPLLSLPPDAWPGMLARPASVLIESPYPLYSIFKLATEGGRTVSLEKGAEAILVSRTDHVSVTLLTEAEAACVASWFNGSTLALALEAGLAVNEQFDISSLLRQLAAVGAIDSVETSHDYSIPEN